MTIEQVQSFVNESITKGAQWERIRILGGEPALHGRLWEILEVLLQYKKGK